MTAQNNRSQWVIQKTRILRILFCGCLVLPWLVGSKHPKDLLATKTSFSKNLDWQPSTTELPPYEKPDTESDAAGGEPATDDHPLDVTISDVESPEAKDCYVQGCSVGMLCVQGQCVPDPCWRVQCSVGKFCRKGLCVKSCGCLRCLSHEICWDGICQANLCAGVLCTSGQICDANSGQCIEDLCTTVTCGPQRICQEGHCVDDPCLGVQCLADQICRQGQCFGNTCAEQEGAASETTHPDSDGSSNHEKTEGRQEPKSAEPAENGSDSEAIDITDRDGGSAETQWPQQESEGWNQESIKPESGGSEKSSAEAQTEAMVSDDASISPDLPGSPDKSISPVGCQCSSLPEEKPGWWIWVILVCFGLWQRNHRVWR